MSVLPSALEGFLPAFSVVAHPSKHLVILDRVYVFFILSYVHEVRKYVKIFSFLSYLILNKITAFLFLSRFLRQNRIDLYQVARITFLNNDVILTFFFKES